MSFMVSEADLYREAVEGFHELNNLIADHPELEWDSGNLRIVKKGVMGKEGTILVMSGISQKPVDYIHTYLAADLEQRPETWVIVHEGSSQYEGSERQHPLVRYFGRLSEVLQIPFLEPTTPYWDPETREAVCRRGDVSERDYDKIVVEMFLGLMDPQQILSDPGEVYREIARSTGYGVNYVFSLLNDRESGDAVYAQRFLPAYQTFSRDRLQIAMDAYPTRGKVLAVVEEKNLPILE